MSFLDRADAGRRLAALLEHLRGPDVVVVGLPRGGVPVAFEVARALGAPLDVIVVRKLGVPFQPELGMGAIGEGGARVVDQAGSGRGRRERRGVRRRGGQRASRARAPGTAVPGCALPGVRWRGAPWSSSTTASPRGRPPEPPARWPGPRAPTRVVLAVPVAPPESVAMLRRDADEVVCLETPARGFFAIGQFYEDFTPTSDGEVVALLERATMDRTRCRRLRQRSARDPSGEADPPLRDEDVEVPVGPGRLSGHLTVPEATRGIVIFAHGSGSSRHSPRNRFVASVLNREGLGTLLFDLLTPDRGARSGQCIRHRPARAQAGRGDALAPGRSGGRHIAHRVFRREHRRRSRALGRRGTRHRHRRRRLTGRTP